MEDYYKESHPDVWKYLSAIIGEEEVNEGGEEQTGQQEEQSQKEQQS